MLAKIFVVRAIPGHADLLLVVLSPSINRALCVVKQSRPRLASPPSSPGRCTEMDWFCSYSESFDGRDPRWIVFPCTAMSGFDTLAFDLGTNHPLGDK